MILLPSDTKERVRGELTSSLANPLTSFSAVLEMINNPLGCVREESHIVIPT